MTGVCSMRIVCVPVEGDVEQGEVFEQFPVAVCIRVESDSLHVFVGVFRGPFQVPVRAMG